MLLAIVSWSGKYDEQTAAPQSFLDQLQQDPQGTEEQIRQKHLPSNYK